MATGLFNLKQVNQAISQGAWSGYIAPKWVEYLVVAGGGGAGYNGGGGGGGGGLLSGIVTIAPSTSYTVTVGGGGAGGTSTGTAGSSGQNSVFGAIASTGGGGGGSFNSGATTGNSGLSGGSGGGGASGYTSINAGTAGQGTANQGNAGNVTGGSIGQPYSGSGGGGAGTIGLSGISNGVSGNGGAGIASSISGTVTAYAGGGAGGAAGSAASPNGIGGVGGGGSAQSTTYGASGYSGSSSLGGGGGGGWGGNGGAGGSGIVVVRYPGNVQFFTGGTVTYSNGYIVHNFTSSGTLAPTTPTVVSEYQISRSLRFNQPDSAYLNRTPASATNQKTWTWSAWVKRGTISSLQTLFGTWSANTDAAAFAIYFNSGDTLNVLPWTNTIFTSTAVFRDPSAWYHIVVAFDSTQTTASNRIVVYVNGVNQAGTYPLAVTQGANYAINSAQSHRLGDFPASGFNTFGGYMTEVNFIDGQALPPTSFGYVNPSTGVWTPAKFVGGYGTNGFYVNFSDNSNTTAATLGKDYSGNGNNWTPNNFSVTAGAGNDSLVDSPTSYGTDTGVGGTVRGNYCTWNPLSNPSGTLSNGNLQIKGGTTRGVWTTFGLTSGKWYWEFNITSASVSNGPYFGISNYASTGQFGTVYALLRSADASYINNGCSVTGVGSGDITSGTVGVAIDVDAGTATLYHNNATRLTVSGIPAGTYYAYFCADATTDQFDLNAGQRPFAYTAPSGYKALCTQNLPTPTIGATTATQAGKYFAPVTYTGTGSTGLVVTTGFESGFVWIKDRQDANTHVLFDQVRGVTKTLASNLTNAEYTNSAGVGLLSFDSTGFTLGTEQGGPGSTNVSARPYISWNWKANGSGSTNTDGSITSTVSANTTSGFSVVTWTANSSSNQSIGHGLGVAPSMVMVKDRTTANNWNIWFTGFTANEYLILNSTGAKGSYSTLWYQTPSSSVFYVGSTGTGANYQNGDAYVAYCFAEVAGYSKFGSYTGNGSADGPFLYLGFIPAYILIKQTTSASTTDWRIITINTSYLSANTSAAQYDSPPGPIRGVSNGVKIVGTGGDINGNGGTFIYAAFASYPFKYALAQPQ